MGRVKGKGNHFNYRILLCSRKIGREVGGWVRRGVLREKGPGEGKGR